MAKFRVLEIGTYYKEFEIDADDHDEAETKVRNGEGTLAKEGNDCDQYETENLSLLNTK